MGGFSKIAALTEIASIAPINQTIIANGRITFVRLI